MFSRRKHTPAPPLHRSCPRLLKRIYVLHGSKLPLPLRATGQIGLEGGYPPNFRFFSEGLEPDSVNERLGRHNLDMLLQF